jgi:hypothetical protein
VEKGGEQRMEGKRLVQPGDRTGGQGECPGDRRVQCRPSWREIKHGFHRMVRPARIPRTAATGWWQPGYGCPKPNTVKNVAGGQYIARPRLSC